MLNVEIKNRNAILSTKNEILNNALNLYDALDLTTFLSIVMSNATGTHINMSHSACFLSIEISTTNY